jgi:hypothetical protein
MKKIFLKNLTQKKFCVLFSKDTSQCRFIFDLWIKLNDNFLIAHCGDIAIQANVNDAHLEGYTQFDGSDFSCSLRDLKHINKG